MNYSNWDDLVEKQENILLKEFLMLRERRLDLILSFDTLYFCSLPRLPSVGKLSDLVMSSKLATVGLASGCTEKVTNAIHVKKLVTNAVDSL